MEGIAPAMPLNKMPLNRWEEQELFPPSAQPSGSRHYSARWQLRVASEQAAKLTSRSSKPICVMVQLHQQNPAAGLSASLEDASLSCAGTYMVLLRKNLQDSAFM